MWNDLTTRFSHTNVLKLFNLRKEISHLTQGTMFNQGNNVAINELHKIAHLSKLINMIELKLLYIQFQPDLLSSFAIDDASANRLRKSTEKPGYNQIVTS